jgi:hypothetical protein
MLLAAMLAMVLVAAAPAFAQATAIQVDNDDDNFGVFDNNLDDFDDFTFDDFDDDDFDFSVGTNEVDLGASQINTGDVNAASVDGDADASIEQDLSLDVTQSNTGFDNIFDNDGILDHVDFVVLVW